MSSHSGEIALFLRRWLANPLRVGAILPSSKALARLVGRNTVRSTSETVLELGAGTGTITQGLIDAGLPEEQLILVELDPDLVAFLRRRFPKATVIEGDATKPLELLPQGMIGRVDTVISGIPALQFPLDKQRSYMDQCFATAAPDGQVLQYTYSLKSPLPYQLLDMRGRRLGLTFANVPPAHLWSYTRTADMPAAAAAE
jgi:phosphatidylethanolamine/phosphatidyl-N-methylethanolamine N-methyltransferase